jgi:hypothetical protein
MHMEEKLSTLLTLRYITTLYKQFVLLALKNI